MTATLDPTKPKHAHALERLAAEGIGWVTTIDPEGTPQSSPIWFLWDDGEVLIYSHRRAVRNDNIADRPRVSFNLNTDPGGDDVVTLEGTARVDLDTVRADANEPYLAKYRQRIADYGWTVEWFAGEYPLPIRISPTRWRV